MSLLSMFAQTNVAAHIVGADVEYPFLFNMSDNVSAVIQSLYFSCHH